MTARVLLLLVAGLAGAAHAAPSDSLTLRWHAPAYGGDCAPDTARPLRDAVWVSVLRLKGQPPFYRRGIEFSTAGWDSVVRYGQPDTLWARWTVPGAACSLKVACGAQFTATVERQACGWKIVVLP